MTVESLPRLTTVGHELDISPERFGWLRSSSHLLDDPGALRVRMQEDGYLFLPGYLDRDEVLDARQVMMDRLMEQGFLDPAYPAIEGVAKEGADLAFRPDLAQNNPPLYKLLYSGRMMEFFTRFFGEEVRHFDFTWIRTMAPGRGTQPHCDIVYMGRGTRDLYTAWTPLGDAPLHVGGLSILEGSHLHERLREGYGRKDVDAYCLNRREEAPNGLGGGGNIARGGVLSPNPVKLRDRLGGRWLTAEYRMGDLLVFSMFTVHASIDNQSDRVRLSSDTRYQRASEPVDERWIGENPIAHGSGAKRGYVC